MRSFWNYLSSGGWHKKLPLAILIFVTLFHAGMLLPELTQSAPDLNDNVFHYTLCLSMQEEIESGGNPIDHWVPYWSLGFPVFHHYQHVPHLIIVSIYNILLRVVSMFFIYHLFIYLMLVFYPLILYYSLRKMHFSSLAAACAALFALGLSNLNGYGFEMGAFIWRGSGMFAQLWAMFLLPLTLSSLYRSLAEDKDYFWSVILLFMLANSQMMFGVVAVVTSFLFLFVNFDLGQIWARVKRLAFILAVFVAVIAYLLLPMMVDSPYHAHSSYDFLEKWDSYGWRYITTEFLNGNILDSGRMAVVTVLTVMGLFIALSRKSFHYRWAGAGFILWFLIYFGRPTWGWLIDLFPLSSALHLHRFVTMVHFFSVILAGIALEKIFEVTQKRFKLVAALALIVVIVLPVYMDRFQYLKVNNTWIKGHEADYQKEAKDFEQMVSYIKGSSPGRVYPGRRANWGKSFKVGRAAVFYLLPIQQIVALSNLPFSWALPGDFSVNFNDFSWSQYNLFNVKFFFTDEKREPPPFATFMKQFGRFKLYGVATTGYFDLVESPIAIYGDKNSVWNATIMWLRSGLPQKKQFMSILFDRKFREGYAHSLLLEDRWKFWVLTFPFKPGDKVIPPKQPPADMFTAAPLFNTEGYLDADAGWVISEKIGKNEFSGRVHAKKDCFLLFKMTYHPGWHAYIDGKEKEKVILSPGLIGVKIDKGEHQVKFIYRAQRWKKLLLLLGIGAAVWLFWRERNRK